ncbi:hypothetical protein HK103_000543 [Boothiomyces macroporosus]|uniref:Uncharacterized protein n=1 Tax=Boothiomyces macroporosus TaxID=261099 RepID=A0AAD5Y5T0_9FUNG|nr:hypothetical protein HK103_000543 [Boothiomyces macroporosus]
MEGTLDPTKTNALSNGVTFNSEDTINDEPLTDQLPPLSPNSKIPSIKIPHAHRMSIVSAISEQPSFISSASSDAIFEVSPVETVKSGQPKRRRIMNEILDTEIRYVSDLQFLKTQYYEPLLALVGTPEEIIPKKAIMDIFGHHESILAVNRELSNQLQKRIELWNRGNDLIGDIFVSLFAAFAKNKAAHPDSHGLVLQAFLILPVQRIPRYKLLLEDLYKHTPEDHPDHENIKKAIESVSQVATFVNETIRNHEAMLQMVDIQKSLIGFKDNLLIPGRRFIRRGRVQKISRRAVQPRELILFSDILIYCSPSILEDHYHFHRMIPLEFCRVEEVVSEDNHLSIFQIVSREKSFAVYVQSEAEKTQWIESIRKAITEWHVENEAIHDRLPSNSPIAEFDAPIWV